MSILNRPSDGLFNILIVFVRTVVAEGAISKDRLLGLCAPDSLEPASSQQLAPKTLNRWIELGLLESTASETVEIAAAFKSRLSKRNFTEEAVVECVRECVLAPDNNSQFWSADENRAADFSRAAAWMLAQDVYSMPTKYDDVESLIVKQIPAKEFPIFQNDTRWSGYLSWSSYLGFGHSVGSNYFVDPTAALEPHVASCLAKDRDTEVRRFLNLLADRVPVIDSGRYRLLLEEQLDRSAWTAPKQDEISSSLSRALLRLQEAGVIQLLDLADATAKMSLLGRQIRPMRHVSHVRLGGAR